MNAGVSGANLPMENVGTPGSPVLRPRMQISQMYSTLTKRWFLTDTDN